MPEPQATGPDDVIVRIGGAGLCRTDLHIIDGWFADVIPADLPVVLGHENAGWVHPSQGGKLCIHGGWLLAALSPSVLAQWR